MKEKIIFFVSYDEWTVAPQYRRWFRWIHSSIESDHLKNRNSMMIDLQKKMKNIFTQEKKKIFFFGKLTCLIRGKSVFSIDFVFTSCSNWWGLFHSSIILLYLIKRILSKIYFFFLFYVHLMNFFFAFFSLTFFFCYTKNKISF